MIGNSTEIGTLSIGSAQNGGITLNGAIVVDDTATFDGPVSLATGAISVTTTNDDITFNHSINGTQTLTLSSGSGAIVIDGAIGDTGILTALSINATDGASGTIEVANIGATNAGASSTVAIGNSTTNTLTLDGTVYNTTSTQTYTAKTGGGNIDITGAATFTTATTDIEFATSDVDLLSLIHI